MRLIRSIVALFVFTALALAGGIKEGQAYSGGVVVHYETAGGVTQWWLDITDEETTQSSPKGNGKLSEDGGTLPRGLVDGDEIVGPDGETYRVEKGKLQLKEVNFAGDVLWRNKRAVVPKGGQA